MTVWAVAGATGLIGRHLCRALLNQGDRVVALIPPDRGSPPLLDDRAEIRTVEFTDSPALERALTGIDACLDLVAPRRAGHLRSENPTSKRPRSGGWTVIPGVVTALLKAGSRAGLRRLVLASSSAVFGHRWAPVGNQTRPAPDTPYGRARLIAEEQALTLGSRLGIQIVVARLTETFGQGSRPHAPLFQAIAQGKFRVVGNGRHPHQLTCVDDAVRALVACGRVPEAAGQAVVISGPEVELRTWIEAIATAAGTSVRFLDALGPPGRLFLRTTGWLPAWAAGGVRRQSWDYMLRPRAYDISSSVDLLGPYHGSDLHEVVRNAMTSYRLHDLRP